MQASEASWAFVKLFSSHCSSLGEMHKCLSSLVTKTVCAGAEITFKQFENLSGCALIKKKQQPDPLLSLMSLIGVSFLELWIKNC